MRHRFLILPAAILCASCGNNADLPPMVDGGGVNNEGADALYARAQSYEQNGKTKKAIKSYDKLADEIPLALKAPEARFRQASLLEQQGDTLDAFDAYQNLITRYQGSGLYSKALKQQADMAFGAADGNIKNSFLGMKSKLSSDKITSMLSEVSDNAPRSNLAARADFKIGEIYAEDDSTQKAVIAYRDVVEIYPDSSLAPEAQFRIGQLLLKEANEGNQDQANLERASEAFADYLSQFPGHKRNAEARKLLASIGNRSIQNSYDIGQFYEKKGDYSSAKYYYQEVIRNTKSGETHDKAQARLSALGGS